MNKKRNNPCKDRGLAEALHMADPTPPLPRKPRIADRPRPEQPWGPSGNG